MAFKMSSREPLLPNTDEENNFYDRAHLLELPSARSTVRFRGPSAGTRLQIARTVNLCLSFFGLGLCFAIPNPTLEDLRKASNTDTDSIYYIYTARSCGYLLGAIAGGLLFDRYNRQFLLFLSHLATAVGILVMPFCTELGALMACTAITGITMAFLDTGGNVWCLDLWGKKSAPILQTLHFCFGLGAFVAPLVADPFLSPHGVQPMLAGHPTNLSNSSSGMVVPPPVGIHPMLRPQFGVHSISHRILTDPPPLAPTERITMWDGMARQRAPLMKRSASNNTTNPLKPALDQDNFYSHQNGSDGFSNQIMLNQTEDLGNISLIYPDVDQRNGSETLTNATEIPLLLSSPASTEVVSVSTPKHKPKPKPALANGEQLPSPKNPWERPPKTAKLQQNAKKATTTPKLSSTVSPTPSPTPAASSPVTQSQTQAPSLTNETEAQLSPNKMNNTTFASNASLGHSNNNTKVNSSSESSLENKRPSATTVAQESTSTASVSPVTTTSTTPPLELSIPQKDAAAPPENSTKLKPKSKPVDSNKSNDSKLKSDAKEIHIASSTESVTSSTATPSSLTTVSSTTASPSTTLAPVINVEAEVTDNPMLSPSITTTSSTTTSTTTTSTTSTTSTNTATTTTTTTESVVIADVDSPKVINHVTENHRTKDTPAFEKDGDGEDPLEVPRSTDDLHLIETDLSPKPTEGHNASSDNQTEPLKDDFFTRLYLSINQRRLGKFEFVYVILGIYIFMVAIVFLIFLCLNPREPRSKQEEETDRSRHVGRSFVIGMIALLSLFLCLYTGIEVAVGQLLQTFATKEQLRLPWSKAYFLPKLFWGSFAFARFVSILLALKLSGFIMLVTDMVICLAASILLVAGADKEETLLWVGIVILGLGLSSVFPTSIVWVERYIHVTNKAASTFILGTALGQIAVPLIINRFINQEPMVLMYVTLVVSVLCFITFIAIWRMATRYGEKYSTKPDRCLYQLANADDVDDVLEMSPAFANNHHHSNNSSWQPLKRKLERT